MAMYGHSGACAISPIKIIINICSVISICVRVVVVVVGLGCLRVSRIAQRCVHTIYTLCIEVVNVNVTVFKPEHTHVNIKFRYA